MSTIPDPPYNSPAPGDLVTLVGHDLVGVVTGTDGDQLAVELVCDPAMIAPAIFSTPSLAGVSSIGARR